MARPTPEQLDQAGTTKNVYGDPEDLLGVLVSGRNPDGTAYSLPVDEPIPEAADILAGHLAHVATTAAATLLTVPAGRVWRGSILIACDVVVGAAVAAAGQALGIIAVAGAGAAPPAGTVASCEARCGANAIGGTVGSQAATSIGAMLVVAAPAGNDVTLTLASTIAGTNGRVSASAIGQLL